MTRYTLTARLGPTRARTSFEAADDTDATFVAIREVLNRAYPNREPWASGHVVLRTGGRVVHEMAEKGTE